MVRLWPLARSCHCMVIGFGLFYLIGSSGVCICLGGLYGMSGWNSSRENQRKQAILKLVSRRCLPDLSTLYILSGRAEKASLIYIHSLHQFTTREASCPLFLQGLPFPGHVPPKHPGGELQRGNQVPHR